MQKKHYLFLTLLSFGTTLFAFGCQQHPSMDEPPPAMMDMPKPEDPKPEDPKPEDPKPEDPEEPIPHPAIEQVRKDWPTQVCSSLGSISGTACFENPRIGTSHVQSVSGLRSDYFWMVGGGNIWNSDGKDAWLSYHEDGLNLYGVYARDEGAAWAVGAKGDQGVILLWDGNKWSSYEGTCLEDAKKKCNSTEVQGQLKRRVLKAVHGTKTGAVWIAATDEELSGTHGFLYQVTGRKKIQRVKTAPNTMGLQNLFALDEKHVWAIGDAGRVLFFNGMSWSSIPTTGDVTSRNMGAVWASSPTDVWVVGGPTIWRFDGTSWKKSLAEDSNRQWLWGIWGNAANDIWAVGMNTILHFDGSTWKESFADAQATYNIVWGNGSNNVWVGGNNGTVLKWNGTKWTNSSFGAVPKVRNLNNVWGTDSEVFVTNVYGEILSNKMMDWTLSSKSSSMGINSIGGTDINNIWLTGNAGYISKWNGTMWSPSTGLPKINITSVSASSATHVWAISSSSTYFHFDGTAWSYLSVFGGNYFNAVAVRDESTSASRAWAVGNGITLLTYDTTATPKLSSSTPFMTSKPLNGVWVLNDNNAWAVGDAGTIYKWNGTAWSLVASGTTENLRSVWGRSATDIWAVGTKGTILHFDGSSWSSVSLNLGKDVSRNDVLLTSVWGNAKGVWTVGSGYVLQLKRP